MQEIQMQKIFVTRTSMPSYEEYIEAIKPLWDSHFVTNMGLYHDELETKLKEYLNVTQMSLMVNGHMALELTIQAMNFPEGSEVITTPFTFVSTTHAIIRNGLKPVFCDIKMSDYTIDESKIEDLVTEKTVAIVPVHVYGNICNVDEIEKIAFKYNLKVIYDAAHAFGEKYKGVGVGNFGNASIFSFHATKVFNTIEGGAACFQDNTLAERLVNLKNFGIRSEELVVSVGANAKMNEFQAIMGLCNLKHLQENIKKRRAVIQRYRECLKKVSGIRTQENREEIEYNAAYFPILVDEKIYGRNRDQLFKNLRDNEIYARKYFYPLTSNQACFKNKYRDLDLKNAQYVSERIMVLPLYPELEMQIVDKICEIIANPT